ncbi:hypothetical protein Acr_10g0010000 [Actinidia rufa]|uniref:Uncharacterized protein n=1 Tax=Actinidia rufa TaxID=165716 RepID=A0A7J0FAD0_9ERIC|nr:hypothetical protein Acr_10g0010000 [Actinidia rufa]
MKLAMKSPLRSPNESIVSRNSFLNHYLAGPFRVAEKALHITSSKYPWSDMSSHYSFCERGQVLSDQSIYGKQHTCTGVAGVDPSVQISDILGVLLDDLDSDKTRLLSRPGLGLGDRCCRFRAWSENHRPNGEIGEIIEFLEPVLEKEVVDYSR